MSKQFSADWVTKHKDIWDKHLSKYIDRPCKFLEVECFEGRSAIFTVENYLTHPSSQLYCFDPYEYSEEFKVTQTISSVDSRYDMDEILARFNKNTYPYRWSGKIVFNQTGVSDGIHSIRCHQFDSAYIDGSHIASMVLSDLVMIWPSMKTESIIIIDDYEWKNNKRKDDPELWTPQLGIDAFLSVFRNRYKLLHMGYQVIIEKIC